AGPAEGAPPPTAGQAPPTPGRPGVVQQQPAQVITIEPTTPQVVYVPSYNPTVVYGTWPYPAAPPYYPYPPGYMFGTAALSFGLGMATAALWGGCNWGGGHADVNINNYPNYSKNVNRTTEPADRAQQGQRGQGGQGQRGGNRSQWQHNPENRRGVQYRDQGTQQKFNRASDNRAVQSREQFRGRAEQGRQDLGGGRGDAGRGQGGARPEARGGGQGRGGGQAGGGGG